LSSGAGQQAHHERNPVQKFGTTGIKPMGRPTLVTRIFMRVVSWSERLNLAFSKVGNPPIYDNAVFPWTRLIENEWRLIRGAHAEGRAARLP
jgi:ornithine lipid ester-linked acyl 2-hydroxylase